MKIFLLIILSMLFGCSYFTVKESQEIKESKILIENPFIINLSTGETHKL